ncbi:hypothetical protein [Paraburkholderia sacchari]|uniref:hypothetical protein n=1 Tax=Paraburkholderia sacchari TaxID=159450 RepID=UPI003D98259D
MVIEAKTGADKLRVSVTGYLVKKSTVSQENDCGMSADELSRLFGSKLTQASRRTAIEYLRAGAKRPEIVKLFQDVRGMAFAQAARIIAVTKSEPKYAAWIKSAVIVPEVHCLQHSFERLATGICARPASNLASKKGVP